MVNEMHAERGFTYLWLLIILGVLSVALAEAGPSWFRSAESERRIELEWAGRQYVRAIASYYESTPGPIKRYPRSLDDLLSDGRFATIKRHLRQLYPNPWSGRPDWNLIRAAEIGRAHV